VVTRAFLATDGSSFVLASTCAREPAHQSHAEQRLATVACPHVPCRQLMSPNSMGRILFEATRVGVRVLWSRASRFPDSIEFSANRPTHTLNSRIDSHFLVSAPQAVTKRS